MNGLRRYPAVVVRRGKPVLPAEFVDWFAGDAAAESGFREILKKQGYNVVSVSIGEVTAVEIA